MGGQLIRFWLVHFFFDFVGTGVICLIIGIFLLILNAVYGKKEDGDLETYVESQLAKRADGTRIVQDV